MSPDTLNLPRPFGRYTLLRRLAVGGMAEVYIARAKGIGGFEKLVAVKVIHPRFSEDEHFIQMLVEEAKISVLLTHNNIAQCFDLGCIEETYFIVMEYIDGADVYKTLKRAEGKKVQFPFDIAAFVASEVCRALDYAHRKRDSEGRPLTIVHRDISPQNVLLSFEGEVKLVDFGIAKAASRINQTEAGVIKGKYYYMSPEQAWGDPMDHRSDIFSIGIVLNEMLTGDMVYRGDNIPDLLDKVRKAEIVSPRTKRAEIPEPLDRIIMKALQKKPEDRYGSAREMATELTDFLYSASPSFRPQRLSALMERLFEGVVRPTADLPLEAAEEGPQVSSMERHEFAPDVNKSVILHFDDEVEEDPTRHDLTAYRVEDKGERSVPGSVGLGSEEDEDAATRVLSQKKKAWDDPTEVSDSGPFMAEVARAVDRAKRASAGPSLPPPVTPFVRPPATFPAPPATFPAPPPSSAALPSPPPIAGATPFVDPFGSDPFVPVAQSTAGHDVQSLMRPKIPRWMLPAVVGVVALIGILTAIVLLVSSPAAPIPQLTIRSEPAGAVVELDGTPQEGVTPLTIQEGLVTGQNHEIRVLHAGYEPWSATFEPAAGSAVQIAVLTRAQSHLQVATEPPGAHVWIDGVLHGTSPLMVPDLEAGRSYLVRAQSEAFGRAEQRVTLANDAPDNTVLLSLSQE